MNNSTFDEFVADVLIKSYTYEDDLCHHRLCGYETTLNVIIVLTTD